MAQDRIERTAAACAKGMTFGVSAIAVITSSVKSFGCGEVNRTRSKPSIVPHARSSLAKAPRSRNSGHRH